MKCTFETAGNASIIVRVNDAPILITDPWINSNPYFGSWDRPFEFTENQKASFKNIKFVWLSHGHPDHLNQDSLKYFKNSTILLPDHFGDRTYNALKELGYSVCKLHSGKSYNLSDNINLYSFSDLNQDASCVISFDNKCAVLNLNDGNAIGSKKVIKEILSNFKTKFVLKLLGWGSGDMSNFFDECGNRIPYNDKPNLAVLYDNLLKDWGCDFTSVFSCFHTFSRSDSIWVQSLDPSINDHLFYPSGKRNNRVIEPYFQYSVEEETFEHLPLIKRNISVREPDYFGDNYSDELNKKDILDITEYFNKIEHIKKCYKYLCFKVGGKENYIDLNPHSPRGIVFETPRNSLMSSIHFEIFDDLLIGNFTKVTLINEKSLYPDFSPYVAKYADNGGAKSSKELRKYFKYYRDLYGLRSDLERLEKYSISKIRPKLENHLFEDVLKRIYRSLRK